MSGVMVVWWARQLLQDVLPFIFLIKISDLRGNISNRAEAHANSVNPRPPLHGPQGYAAGNPLKRPRSPMHERYHSPSAISTNSGSYREDKRRKSTSTSLSTRDARDMRNSGDQGRDMRNSSRQDGRQSHQGKEVWSRLEVPRKSDGELYRTRGRNNEHTHTHSRYTSRKEASQSRITPSLEWRQRHSLEDSRNRDANNKDANNKDANNKGTNTRATINYVSRHVQHDRTERPRATEDSQKTISDTRVSLETGECAANRGASTGLAETEEEKSRRLKGKAVATDSPTSKNTAELIASANRSAKLIISEPSKQPQHNSARSKRYGSSPLEHSDKYMDLEMSQVRDLDIPLTEVELAEVDNLILETERLEMDENMLDIDNDDPLGDSPDLDAEKIEAISQLSPANAVITKAAPPAQLPLKEKAVLPPHEPTTEAQPPTSQKRAEAHANSVNPRPPLHGPQGYAAGNPLKRPRSPMHERYHSPSAISTNSGSYREDKRRKSTSTSLSTRDAQDMWNSGDQGSDMRNSSRQDGRQSHQGKQVWSKLEVPRKSDGELYRTRGRNNEHTHTHSRYTSRKEASQSRITPSLEWRQRHSLEDSRNRDANNKDANNKGANTRATINYVSRECAANRGASTGLAETEEEKSRRIKGKAVATDSPTSKNTAELIASANRSAKLIISEPSEQPQHNSARSKRYGSSPLEHSDKYMDLEMSQVQDLDIPLTEVELAEVDNLILETERLEMNENMLDIDNDDPLGDSPDLDAEKIEAISQLSPANAVITKAAPPPQLPLNEKAVLPPHEPTTEAQPPYVPKGLLEKKALAPQT
ncbi:hypothetical protein F2Q68_00017159 [Brassica cretica]|uniref:Uncharacterized protein n=1 Tax=Brassica cretica TaxID=69181 RepID=A0A8S9HH74_BRACR|nr:hypothetical protein F2Q68_00017159 [Brassica cretica]